MNRLTLVLVSLLASPVLAAAPAGSVSGEWLSGAAFPPAVYEEAFAGATTSGARLLLRPDGRYSRTELDFSYVPGFFGSYVVTCGTLKVHAESGRYTVSGDRLQFQPEQVREISGLSPSDLNAGCKRSNGSVETPKPAPYQASFALSETQFSVNVQGTRRMYGPRPTHSAPPLPVPAAPATASARLPASTPTPVVTPTPRTASGTWNAVLELQGDRLNLRFNLYDDGEKTLSGSGFEGDTYVAWVLGPRGGAFDLNLDTGDGEVRLRVRGQFQGNRYVGTFEVLDALGQVVAEGTLNMVRDDR